jgi:hypothetical protein
MRRFSTWFALILIASALLLSAGNVSAQNTVNQRASHPNSNLAGDRSQTLDTTPTTQPAPHSASGQQLSDKGAQKETYALWLWTLFASITAQGFFNFFVMVATVAMAIFTYQLVHANRPFFIFEKERMSGYHPHPSTLTAEEKAYPFNIDLLLAQITVRNAGNGPAVIHSAVGLLTICSHAPKPWRFSRYRECRELFVSDRMFAPNEFAELVSSGLDARLMTQEEFDSVRDDKLRVFFYGRVKYRSMLGGRFKANFYYVFAPPHGVYTEPAMVKVRHFTRQT